MSASKRRSSLKLIILGDSRYFFKENTNKHSVGKTCIIQQFVFNKFSDKYKSTIGADFFPRDVMIDNTPYSVQVRSKVVLLGTRSGIRLVRNATRVLARLSIVVRMLVF